MKALVGVLAGLLTLAASPASAQGVDLSGRYRCVELCRDGLVGQPAFITQNGWNLNLLNESGEPSRAWIDWVGHIWAQNFNEGAVYSPDGMIIRFDRGTVWQRDLEPELVPVEPRRGRRRAVNVPPDVNVPPVNVPPAVNVPPGRIAVGRTAFDGSWGVVIQTQSGNCDPEYRFGAQIINGNVVYDGGAPVNLQGQVAPNGSVWVSVSAGGQRADGEGRMSPNVGTGTWRGQGAAGTCAGTWQAARRG